MTYSQSSIGLLLMYSSYYPKEKSGARRCSMEGLTTRIQPCKMSSSTRQAAEILPLSREEQTHRVSSTPRGAHQSLLIDAMTIDRPRRQKGCLEIASVVHISQELVNS